MREFSESKFQENFSDSIQILKIINDSGYEAYFVGGCVRDYLLGQKFDDIDITTSATPEEVKKIFPKTFDTGIQHGTVTVIHKGNTYEVTTFRAESDYEKHRAPKSVEFIRSLDKDLERRDFTINAMVLDKDGKLTDLHSGKEDLEKKVIRTVNEPNERFNEDALRMLRAFRFVSKLGFDIDEKTLDAIEKNKELMTFISVERIVGEFRKIFKGKNLKLASDLLLNSKLHKYMEFFKNVHTLDGLDNKFSWEESLFYILDKNEIPYSELKKLKLSKKEYNLIKEYINIKEKFENKDSLDLILYKHSRDKLLFINEIFSFVEKDDIENLELVITDFADVDIEMNDIINLFPEKKAGPWIKEVVSQIEYKILHRELKNEKYDIINFIKSIEEL